MFIANVKMSVLNEKRCINYKDLGNLMKPLKHYLIL